MYKMVTRTQCPFCDRDLDTTELTCGRYSCDPDLDTVLDAFDTDDLYLRTNYKGQMQLYYNVHGNPVRDERIWSDSKDARTIALLNRLGISKR